MPSVERYQPKNREEALDPIAGNVFMSDSVEAMVNLVSRNFILKDLRDARERFPHRAQSMLTLERLMEKQEKAFIYLPRVRHNKKFRPNDSEHIVVFDQTARQEIAVPKSKIDLFSGDLNDTWESDVILLATYPLFDTTQNFTLSLLFGELIRNPRADLGFKLLHHNLEH